MTKDQFIDNFFKYAGKVNPIYRQETEESMIDVIQDFFDNPQPEDRIKIVELTEKQLRLLKTREAKAGETLHSRSGALYLGTVWLPYGDENYYILPNGEVITEYFSIGD